MRKITKNIIKLLIFVFIATLPFISITQIIGIDTFLDSFENPEHYVCLQDKNNSLNLDIQKGGYVIVQKSSHPTFYAKASDYIIYNKINGEIACNKINSINTIGALKIYYVSEQNDPSTQPIYDLQIIGKVVNIIDNNIWNSISISLWEISINNLNIRV